MNGQPTSGASAVIDLGAGWQQQQPGSDRPRPRAVQRPLTAAVAVALVLALGGAAPARRLDELAAITLSLQGDFQIVDEVLLVRDADRLAGYSLDDGTQRWNIALPGMAGSGMAPAGTVPGLMVTEMQDKLTGHRTTYAVDVATGAIRWQDDDLSLTPLADVAVAITPTGEDLAFAQITVRDLRTGRPRWSAQNVLPAVNHLALLAGPGPMPIWTLQTTGELSERDLRDGRLLRSHRLDLGEAVPVDLSIVGDELILETVLGDTKTVARYSTADLAPVPLTAPFVRRADCGAYWCTSSLSAELGPTADPVEIVDKATGVVRRRFAGGSLVVPTPVGLLVVGPEPRGRGLPATALLDAATAEPLADLTGWNVYLDYPGTVTVLTRGTGPGQVAWLRPGGLDMAQLPVPVDRCVFAPRAVACPHPAGVLTVWRRTG
ncbi:PQQ-binding-like beta-propeller repeat protein [Catellatospora sichuanensis]|uniref:outer membrane protein assembly factor BamB family protein n=1 Tax=Catellatospora sichuanensis TaxID=1969805 RepID=UPI001642D06B|nr:PQQ-binding-like beta-propeller repeat protein [Catellatospora sichuanensis]